jgi:hypothetical protein
MMNLDSVAEGPANSRQCGGGWLRGRMMAL